MFSINRGTVKERVSRWRRGLNEAAHKPVSWRTILLLICIGTLGEGFFQLLGVLDGQTVWRWRELIPLGFGILLAVLLARNWHTLGELDDGSDS